MHHVVIEKLCNCAKKRNTEQVRSFDTKQEAEEHAYEWADTLNNSFCGKHGFDVIEVDDNYVISVEVGGFIEACEI
jgi:HSP20 family molecular chaperone IbpA